MIHLLKELNVKNRYLILLFKGRKKLKQKDAIKARKAKAAAKKDSLLNRKRPIQEEITKVVILKTK
jgi:hypothetical protein